MADVLGISSRPTVARKTHYCSCCTKEIPAGSKYYKTAMLNDGDFYVWKCHKQQGHCGDLSTRFYADEGEFCELCDPDRN